MFELIEIRNYDTHHNYGTNWHTDYIIKTDEELNIQELIKKLQEFGQQPCGNCKLRKVEGKDEIILETITFN